MLQNVQPGASMEYLCFIMDPGTQKPADFEQGIINDLGSYLANQPLGDWTWLFSPATIQELQRLQEQDKQEVAAQYMAAEIAAALEEFL